MRLVEKLRRIAAPAAGVPAAQTAARLPGERIQADEGPLWVRRLEVPLGFVHGRLPLAEVRAAAPGELADVAREPRLKAFVARLKSRAGDESQARVLVRDLVLAVSAALLIRHAPNTVSAAFIASRLGDGPETFGMLAAGADCRSILSRAAANPS